MQRNWIRADPTKPGVNGVNKISPEHTLNHIAILINWIGAKRDLAGNVPAHDFYRRHGFIWFKNANDLIAHPYDLIDILANIKPVSLTVAVNIENQAFHTGITHTQ